MPDPAPRLERRRVTTESGRPTESLRVFHAEEDNPITAIRRTAVKARLEDPSKFKIRRPWRQKFQRLGEGYKAIEEDKRNTPGWENLPLEEKGRRYQTIVREVFEMRGKAGRAEFQALVAAGKFDVIGLMAEDFVGTVTRELISREELKLFAREREIQQDVEGMILGDKKVNRGKIIKRIFDGLKARTKRARETARVNKRLKLSDTEKEALQRISREQYIMATSTITTAPAELTPEQRILREQKKALRRVLGAEATITDDLTPITKPEHIRILETMENQMKRRGVTFARIADAERDLQKKRQELVDATRTGDTGRITKAISTLRAEEVRHKATLVALRGEETWQEHDRRFEQNIENYRERVRSGGGRGKVRLSLGNLVLGGTTRVKTGKIKTGSVAGSVGARSLNRMQELGNWFIRVGRHTTDKVLWGRWGKIVDSVRSWDQLTQSDQRIYNALYRTSSRPGEAYRMFIGDIALAKGALREEITNREAAAASGVPEEAPPAGRRPTARPTGDGRAAEAGTQPAASHTRLTDEEKAALESDRRAAQAARVQDAENPWTLGGPMGGRPNNPRSPEPSSGGNSGNRGDGRRTDDVDSGGYTSSVMNGMTERRERTARVERREGINIEASTFQMYADFLREQIRALNDESVEAETAENPSPERIGLLKWYLIQSRRAELALQESLDRGALNPYVTYDSGIRINGQPLRLTMPIISAIIREKFEPSSINGRTERFTEQQRREYAESVREAVKRFRQESQSVLDNEARENEVVEYITQSVLYGMETINPEKAQAYFEDLQTRMGIRIEGPVVRVPRVEKRPLREEIQTSPDTSDLEPYVDMTVGLVTSRYDEWLTRLGNIYTASGTMTPELADQIRIARDGVAEIRGNRNQRLPLHEALTFVHPDYGIRVGLPVLPGFEGVIDLEISRLLGLTKTLRDVASDPDSVRDLGVTDSAMFTHLETYLSNPMNDLFKLATDPVQMSAIGVTHDQLLKLQQLVHPRTNWTHIVSSPEELAKRNLSDTQLEALRELMGIRQIFVSSQTTINPSQLEPDERQQIIDALKDDVVRDLGLGRVVIGPGGVRRRAPLTESEERRVEREIWRRVGSWKYLSPEAAAEQVAIISHNLSQDEDQLFDRIKRLAESRIGPVAEGPTDTFQARSELQVSLQDAATREISERIDRVYQAGLRHLKVKIDAGTATPREQEVYALANQAWIDASNLETRISANLPFFDEMFAGIKEDVSKLIEERDRFLTLRELVESGAPTEDVSKAIKELFDPTTNRENFEATVKALAKMTGLREDQTTQILDTFFTSIDWAIDPATNTWVGTGTITGTPHLEINRIISVIGPEGAKDLFTAMTASERGRTDTADQLGTILLNELQVHRIPHPRAVAALTELIRKQPGILRDIADKLHLADPTASREFLIREARGTTEEISRFVIENSRRNPEKVNEYLLEVFTETATRAEAARLLRILQREEPAGFGRFIEYIVEQANTLSVKEADRVFKDVAKDNPEVARRLATKLAQVNKPELKGLVDTITGATEDSRRDFLASRLEVQMPGIVGNLLDSYETRFSTTVPPILPGTAAASLKVAFEDLVRIRGLDPAIARGIPSGPPGTPLSPAAIKDYIKSYLQAHPEHAGDFIRQLHAKPVTRTLVNDLITEQIKGSEDLLVGFIQERMAGNLTSVTEVFDKLEATPAPAVGTPATHRGGRVETSALIHDVLQHDPQRALELLTLLKPAKLTEAKAAIGLLSRLDRTTVPGTSSTAPPSEKTRKLIADELAARILGRDSSQFGVFIDKLGGVTPSIIADIASTNPQKAAELFGMLFKKDSTEAVSLFASLVRDEDTFNRVVETFTQGYSSIWTDMISAVIKDHPNILSRVIAQQVTDDLKGEKQAEVDEKNADIQFMDEITSKGVDPIQRAKTMRETIEKRFKKLAPIMLYNPNLAVKMIEEVEKELEGEKDGRAHIDINKAAAKVRELQTRNIDQTERITSFMMEDLREYQRGLRNDAKQYEAIQGGRLDRLRGKTQLVSLEEYDRVTDRREKERLDEMLLVRGEYYLMERILSELDPSSLESMTIKFRDRYGRELSLGIPVFLRTDQRTSNRLVHPERDIDVELDRMSVPFIDTENVDKEQEEAIRDFLATYLENHVLTSDTVFSEPIKDPIRRRAEARRLADLLKYRVSIIKPEQVVTHWQQRKQERGKAA